MSWDLFAFKSKPLPFGEEPKREDHLPLGTVAEVRRAIEMGDLETDWGDAFWCHHDGNGFRIEFNIGSWNSEDDDLLYHVDLVVRGEGDPWLTLKRFSQEHGWLLEDLATGRILDPAMLEVPGLDKARKAEAAMIAETRKKNGIE